MGAWNAVTCVFRNRISQTHMRTSHATLDAVHRTGLQHVANIRIVPVGNSTEIANQVCGPLFLCMDVSSASSLRKRIRTWIYISFLPIISPL